jgi:hypothetical protein
LGGNALFGNAGGGDGVDQNCALAGPFGEYGSNATGPPSALGLIVPIGGPAVPGAGETGGAKLGTAPKPAGGGAVPGAAPIGKRLLGGNAIACAAAGAAATSTAKPATTMTLKRITGSKPPC